MNFQFRSSKMPRPKKKKQNPTRNTASLPVAWSCTNRYLTCVYKDDQLTGTRGNWHFQRCSVYFLFQKKIWETEVYYKLNSCLSLALGGCSLIYIMIYLCRRAAGSTPVMSSLWWEQWLLGVGNGSTPIPFMNYSGCFSSTQSTVLKGVKFGGVPVVLLLDFCVFLVCVCLPVCDEDWKSCDPSCLCFFMNWSYRQKYGSPFSPVKKKSHCKPY